MKQIFRVIMCLALFAGLPAFADFQKGWDAYEKSDYATALREWRPLAEQGSASAQYNLGVIYENGQGVPQNYKQAIKWYLLSAKQGDVGAQFNVGNMYNDGQGVPQDGRQAVKWLTLAAENRHAQAQYNLAVLYYKGDGVPQDYVRVHLWFNLAASNGLEKGAESRDDIAKSMTTEQIAEAQKRASECFAKDYKGC